MTTNSPNQDTLPSKAAKLRWPAPLRRQDQVALLGVMVFLACLIVASWLFRGAHHQHSVDMREAQPQTYRFEVDLNSATWNEIALLPGIGEVTARAIVQFREKQGGISSLAALTEIDGISAETVNRLRPHVVPMEPPFDVAGR